MSRTIHIHRLSKLIAGVSICLAGVTWASPDTDRFPISIADLEAKAATRFATIDSDQSGNIDMAEFEGAKMQRAHPGARRGERQRHKGRGHKGQGHKGPAAEGHGTRAVMQAELFSILDTDDNGNLSQAEFTADNQREARHQAQKRAMFKGLDRDGNNLLSVDEFPRAPAHLSAADADQDGLITKTEMKAFRAAQRSKRHPKAG